jgi:hypothetical protein
LASLPELGLRPLATSQPSGRPSPSLSGFVISVPWFCSSALVNPSPSQSAPPSEGSRGSVPSPDAAEADIKIIRSATNTLRFFRFIFFISPLFFNCREPAVLSFQGSPSTLGSLTLGVRVCKTVSRACAQLYYSCGVVDRVQTHQTDGLRSTLLRI